MCRTHVSPEPVSLPGNTLAASRFWKFIRAYSEEEAARPGASAERPAASHLQGTLPALHAQKLAMHAAPGLHAPIRIAGSLQLEHTLPNFCSPSPATSHGFCAVQANVSADAAWTPCSPGQFPIGHWTSPVITNAARVSQCVRPKKPHQDVKLHTLRHLRQALAQSFMPQYALCRPTELPGQGHSCMARSWRSASSGRISIPRTAQQPSSSCTTRTSLVGAWQLHQSNKPFLYHPHIFSDCIAFAAQQQDSAVLLAWHGMAWHGSMHAFAARKVPYSATTDKSARLHVWETRRCGCQTMVQQSAAAMLIPVVLGCC